MPHLLQIKDKTFIKNLHSNEGYGWTTETNESFLVKDEISPYWTNS